MNKDTIAAIATAPGKSGIGVVRISGNLALSIAEKITHGSLKPRYAQFCKFRDSFGSLLDEGIAIYFPAPNSFTGEHVVELQGHGSTIVLDLIVKEIISLGGRLANPGEFSERAFLNNKIDLVQAEAIADLIESNSAAAALSAMRSLSGEFSKKIDHLIVQLTQLRIYVEAAIDFPEEEVDFLSDKHISQSTEVLLQDINTLIVQSKQGAVLKSGISVVLLGAPNSGKSSLLNLLAKNNRAIVNKQAGTTRDTLHEDILLDGLPLRIIDTAGLRETHNEIEQEGINRAVAATHQADLILFLRDASKPTTSPENDIDIILDRYDIKPSNMIVINNKIDLIRKEPTVEKNRYSEISISIKFNLGHDLLIKTIKDSCNFNDNTENVFVARRRHIDALEKAQQVVLDGQQQLKNHHAGELLAEDLRTAQGYLGSITGQMSADDLLGEIFSSFCIGK